MGEKSPIFERYKEFQKERESGKGGDLSKDEMISRIFECAKQIGEKPKETMHKIEEEYGIGGQKFLELKEEQMQEAMDDYRIKAFNTEGKKEN